MSTTVVVQTSKSAESVAQLKLSINIDRYLRWAEKELLRCETVCRNRERCSVLRLAWGAISHVGLPMRRNESAREHGKVADVRTSIVSRSRDEVCRPCTPIFHSVWPSWGLCPAAQYVQNTGSSTRRGPWGLVSMRCAHPRGLRNPIQRDQRGRPEINLMDCYVS